VQIIGKSARPRVQKNTADINTAFGVDYNHQRRARQDTASYMRLLHRRNRIAKTKSCIFYVLQDNCSSHVAAAKIMDLQGSIQGVFKFENLVLIFFLANATNDCQPLDQGIIRSFKAAFRRLQLKYLLAEYKFWSCKAHSADEKFPMKNFTHMRNVLGWVRDAYDQVDSNLIRWCFVKANCLPLISSVDLNMDVDQRRPATSEFSQSMDQLISMLADLQVHKALSIALGVDREDTKEIAEEIFTLDAQEPTGHDQISEDDILQDVPITHNILEVDVEDPIEDSKEIRAIVHISQAILAITTLFDYLPCSFTISKELWDEAIDLLSQICRPLLAQERDEKLAGLKQAIVRDFFNPIL
jgi:hypothetical protein